MPSCERVGGLLTQVRLPEGTVLLHQGATDHQFLVLAEGQARGRALVRRQR